MFGTMPYQNSFVCLISTLGPIRSGDGSGDETKPQLTHLLRKKSFSQQVFINALVFREFMPQGGCPARMISHDARQETAPGQQSSQNS